MPRTKHSEKISEILRLARKDAEAGYTNQKDETIDEYIDGLREALSRLNAVEINQQYEVMTM